MPTKRESLYPNISDTVVEYRLTKSRSEPTSVKETFTSMLINLFQKSLFDINHRVAIYLMILSILPLVADVVTFPEFYLSHSDNVFNKFFVEFAWGWNLILLTPFIMLTTKIFCCGQRHRIFKDHLLRIGVATFFWWLWTTAFNIIKAFSGSCQYKQFSTMESCLKAGHLWNGYDISGHTFILIYGSLFLMEETRIMENWDSIEEELRPENHHKLPLRHLSDEEIEELQTDYVIFTPYVQGLFVAISLLQIMWDVMLIVTMLYYHVMVEKFLAGVLAMMTWFCTYRIWYGRPKLIPKLPGQGIFHL